MGKVKSLFRKLSMGSWAVLNLTIMCAVVGGIVFAGMMYLFPFFGLSGSSSFMLSMILGLIALMFIMNWIDNSAKREMDKLNEGLDRMNHTIREIKMYTDLKKQKDTKKSIFKRDKKIDAKAIDEMQAKKKSRAEVKAERAAESAKAETEPATA